MNLRILILGIVFLAACGKQDNASTEETAAVEESAAPTVTATSFGQTPDGAEVDEYTITNSNGLEMKVITYGGIITSLSVPDRDGNLGDVVLGYDNLDQYISMNPYFGAIIGRYGNRIAGGKFTLDGEEYSLATNDNTNHLHGGVKGFDKVVWQAEPFETDDAAGLKMTYSSADMEEGYPGKLDVTVTYTLDNDNRLIFDYAAITDKPTVVNLTNHSYYNLTGMQQDILGHQLVINADEYLPVDNTLIPTDPAPVAGTPFDFTEPKVIGSEIGAENEQIANGGGYDHCWIINESSSTPAFAASLFDPESGRFMEVFTTEPGIQFYSGNFLDGTATGKNGVEYGYRSGLCLETQHYPDSPNRTDFPMVELRPGERYASRTVTVFSTK